MQLFIPQRNISIFITRATLILEPSFQTCRFTMQLIRLRAVQNVSTNWPFWFKSQNFRWLWRSSNHLNFLKLPELLVRVNKRSNKAFSHWMEHSQHHHREEWHIMQLTQQSHPNRNKEMAQLINRMVLAQETATK